MKPVQTSLLHTATLQALPLFLLLLFTQLSLKIPHRSLAARYPSFFLFLFLLPKPAATRDSGGVPGVCGNTTNSRQTLQVRPSGHFHGVRVAVLVFIAYVCQSVSLGYARSIGFCLENVNLGKVFVLAEPDVWQRSTLWFAVSLHLLPHRPGLGAHGLLGFHGLGFGGCPWSQGSANPHPHGDRQSPEGAAKLVVKCGLHHLPLHNADILSGIGSGWRRMF